MHDVGLTGLALLTFLGQGNTHNEGVYRDVVRRGVVWLVRQQDERSGLIGSDASHDFVYDHTIATLALCEAYLLSGGSPFLIGACEDAVGYLLRARNPYGAWRYDVPPSGDADTSVTGWAVLALTSARDAGLAVDSSALEGALSWIDEVTDPASGRVGPGRWLSTNRAMFHSLLAKLRPVAKELSRSSGSRMRSVPTAIPDTTV